MSHIALSLTIMIQDPERATQISEKFQRIAMGLALEGIYVSMSFSREQDEIDEDTETRLDGFT